MYKVYEERSQAMTLNLSVLSADLGDLSGDPKAAGGVSIAKTLINPSLGRKLRFPVIYDGETRPQDDRLYIAKAGSLQRTLDLSAHPSFLCIGVPPKEFLNGFCDIVIVSTKTKINALLATTVELFDKYNAWERDLQNAIIQNQSIKMLALISEPIFMNPLQLYDKNYKCIFSISSKNKYALPDNYFEINDNEYLDIEQINLIETFPRPNTKKIPLLTDKKFRGYRELIHSIFVKNRLAGALLVAEIHRTITDRDHALIMVLADVLAAMIQKTETLSLGKPRRMEEILEKMLGHRPVKLGQLGSMLAEMNWNLYDTYFCVTVESQISGYDYSARVAMSLKLSEATGTECYLIQKNAAVFIFNLTESKLERSALVKTVISVLKNSAVIIGVSNSFSNFNNIYYYYRQTLAAIEQGREKEPSPQCCYFDDYILDSILQNSYKDMAPEALYPEGFLALERHDKAKGTNYVDTLEAFLECNMNIADTIKRVFMHRNTFLYRIGRIKELLGMDLDKGDTRLLLRIILKIRKRGS
jgi:sugar diacid utilization regulator